MSGLGDFRIRDVVVEACGGRGRVDSHFGLHSVLIVGRHFVEIVLIVKQKTRRSTVESELVKQRRGRRR